MVFTEDFNLPTVEELTVQEVNLSSATLRAAGFHLGKYCEAKNNEFMLCRNELKDPRKCIKEGKEVTACSLEFFRLLKNNCKSEFNQYAHCVDQSSNDYSFKPCRKTQSVYDACVLEKMNIERPGYGYYCRARIHDSDRPKPPRTPKAVYSDIPAELPPNAEKIPAKYGTRFYWLND